VHVVDAEQEARAIVIEGADGQRHAISIPHESADWMAAAVVKEGAAVEPGQTLAKTDSERAYVVMMRRYLPVGLLGLVVASLLAAFMSTIDTHVNLAASFFVNDLYRRFFRPEAPAQHYVTVARVASVGVLLLAGVMASYSDSISDLFLFFLAFLGGVGPVYVLRWLWWRVQASTEITAMIASASATIFLTFAPIHWELGPFSEGGKLAAEGRLCLVVLTSLCAALVSLVISKQPDPRLLVEFYRKVRPAGFWGPVAALAPDVERPREGLTALIGIVGGMAMVYGLMLGLGFVLLGDNTHGALGLGIALVGAVGVTSALKRQMRSSNA
jgi:solute:Na+ symporter, SSS family